MKDPGAASSTMQRQGILTMLNRVTLDQEYS
jgi:hypothetical protein